MPDTNSTRVTPNMVRPYKGYDPSFGITFTGDAIKEALGTCQQVTASYRTGRAAWGHDNEDLLPTGNGFDAFKALKSEYDRSGTTAYDRGHPFTTTTQRLLTSSGHYRLTGSGGAWYEGPLVSNPAFNQTISGHGPKYPTIPAFDSNAYGVAAIKATIPTNPVADLAVSLAELKREGFPHVLNSDLLKEKVNVAREAGGEHLNIEFGWKPILNEVRNLASIVSKSARMIEQYERGSGVNTRRRHTFPVQTESWSIPDHGGEVYPLWNRSYWQRLFPSGGSSGIVSETVTLQRRIWFSGAYTYHLHDGDSSSQKLKGFEQKFNHLFGLRLTPEVIWNLAPWSWLADWNFNIGSNISNATALSQDGLVMRYGYLMCDTVVTRSSTLRGAFTTTGTLPPFTTSFVQHRKERVKATPYGFGLNPASFNGRQWAILAALGMTKTPSSLR